MVTADILDHVERLQELRFFRAFYRLVVLFALLVIVSVSVWFVSYISNTVGGLKKVQYELKVDVAILQDRMTNFQQLMLRTLEHDNANFDATKSQIRETTAAVKALGTAINELKAVKQVEPPKKRKRD